MKPSRRRSKTDSILNYLMERANRPIGLSEISSDLGFDGKVVATIASRLALRGYVRKVRRGVYLYEDKHALSRSDIETVYRSLVRSIEKTVGRPLLRKLAINHSARNDGTFDDLEDFATSLRNAMGTSAANEVIAVVIQSELPQESGRYLMKRLGI